MEETEKMVQIVEVGPRDGLQNETAPVPTEVKIDFVNALSFSGVNEIEVTAFVSPRWVPQLADASAVFEGISRRKGVIYSALVPNQQGLERALQSRVEKVAVFTAVSETFNRKNVNASFEESLRRFIPVTARARREGLPVRGYVSTAFWCAFEGKIAPEAVVDAVHRIIDIGIEEVSISDTIGKAAPEEVKRLLDLLLVRVSPEQVAMHFHDTYGRAVANVRASWPYGIRTYDASVGGLGGCPYAPGAAGNVATEDLVSALGSMGARVKVDRQQLSHARRLLDPYLQEDRRIRPQQDLPACSYCENPNVRTCPRCA